MIPQPVDCKRFSLPTYPGKGEQYGHAIQATEMDSTGPQFSKRKRTLAMTNIQSLCTKPQPNFLEQEEFLKEQVTLLGEIVGANGLWLHPPKETSASIHSNQNDGPDNNSGDSPKDSADAVDPHNAMEPFCTVSWGSKVIHQTEPCTNRGRNPLWTPCSTHSLFVLSATLEELQRKPFLKLTVWTTKSSHHSSYDKNKQQQKQKEEPNHPHGHVFLGKARVPVSTVLKKCNEERITVDLVDEWNNPDEDKNLDGEDDEQNENKNSVHRRYQASSLQSLLRSRHASDKIRGSVTLRFRHAGKSDQVVVNRLDELFHSTPRREMDPTTLWTLLNHPRQEHAPSPPLLHTKQSKRATRPSLLVTEVDETELATGFSGAGSSSSPVALIHALSSAFQSNSVRDEVTGQIKHRVKPYPDPKHISTTTFLSKEQIQEETQKPSHHWIKAGSGGVTSSTTVGRDRTSLGKVYLEILSCHDLPNLDAVVAGQSVGGDVTDAFVTAVLEDAMVQTDVIDNELSPHWLPWTKRAFCFGILHPASMLYLGCFDWDSTSPLSTLQAAGGTQQPHQPHDAIGRVAVNLCNLQRNVDHTLQYHWHPSSNVTERKTVYGTVTIRIRVEIPNEQAALWAILLQPRPTFHVNVHKDASLQVLCYTCFGQYGDEQDEQQQFDLTVIRSYLNELREYKLHATLSIGQAWRSLVFWRGQVHVGGGVHVPLYSLIFFGMASTLVERPQLFPALFLLSIGWILLVTGAQRQSHPSPWHRCPSFWQNLYILLCGNQDPVRSSSWRDQQRPILPWEGHSETVALEREWQELVERHQQDTEEALERVRILQQLKHGIGRNSSDPDNTHKAHSGTLPSTNHHHLAERLIPVEWLARLGVWQGGIAVYLRHMRLAKIIVTWEESVISFWVTVCFLFSGFVALFLPWGWILTWVGRALVWGLLGPHMMIVDAYKTQQPHLPNSQSNGKNDSSGQVKRRRLFLQNTFDRFNQLSKRELLKAQQTAKHEEVKSMLFGNYSTRVPNFNLSRHFDRPLPVSFSSGDSPSPFIENDSSTVDNFSVPGQQLFGVMVPRFEQGAIAFEKERPILKARAMETKECMDRIIKTRDGKGSHSRKSQCMNLARLETLRSSVPAEVGYEMLPSGCSMTNHDNQDHSGASEQNQPVPLLAETPVSVNSSASLEVDENAQVAVLSFERRFSSYEEGGSSGGRRKSLRYGYEMIHYDPSTLYQGKLMTAGTLVEDQVAEEHDIVDPSLVADDSSTRTSSSLTPTERTNLVEPNLLDGGCRERLLDTRRGVDLPRVRSAPELYAAVRSSAASVEQGSNSNVDRQDRRQTRGHDVSGLGKQDTAHIIPIPNRISTASSFSIGSTHRVLVDQPDLSSRRQVTNLQTTLAQDLYSMNDQHIRDAMANESSGQDEAQGIEVVLHSMSSSSLPDDTNGTEETLSVELDRNNTLIDHAPEYRETEPTATNALRSTEAADKMVHVVLYRQDSSL